MNWDAGRLAQRVLVPGDPAARGDTVAINPDTAIKGMEICHVVAPF